MSSRVSVRGVAGSPSDVGLEPSAASATLRPVSERQGHGKGPAIGWLDRKEQRRGLRPRDAAYLIVAVWLVVVVIFGIVEHLLDDQTFPTVWLGMWWALQTVTTVGYGDVVPQDSVGRVIASFLLLGGLALLSVVTATITSGFVARAQREARSGTEAELLAAIRELRARVDELGRAPRAVTVPLLPVRRAGGAPRARVERRPGS